MGLEGVVVVVSGDPPCSCVVVVVVVVRLLGLLPSAVVVEWAVLLEPPGEGSIVRELVIESILSGQISPSAIGSVARSV